MGCLIFGESENSPHEGTPGAQNPIMFRVIPLLYRNSNNLFHLMVSVDHYPRSYHFGRVSGRSSAPFVFDFGETSSQTLPPPITK